MDSLFNTIAAVYADDAHPAVVLFATAVLWFAGAVIASFSGLVASRIGSVPEGRSVIAAISCPASYCDGCRRPLSPLELVPVIGWVLSRGRCNCGQKVSPFYPLAEFLAGTATAAVPFVAGGSGPVTVALIGLIWAGLLVSWIDLREHIIPDEMTFVLLFAGLLLSPFEEDAYMRAAGAAACCGAMWISLALTGWLKGVDTRAGGDVAMAAAAGAWIGVGGVPAYLLFACAFFAAHCIPLRLKGTDWVPMGPSLCAALVAACLLGGNGFVR